MKRHALFVGVNDYADPTILNLAFPTEDAAALASAFELLLKFDRVEKLYNPAHASEIIDKVNEMKCGLGGGDLFFFFFAGHGFRVKDNHVLVCAKDEFEDLEDEDAGLRVGQLKKKMRGPWNRMIVLDACQNDIRSTRGTEYGMTARDLELIHAEDAKPRNNDGAQILVTSCSEGQKALEVADLGHGLFTSAFLESVKAFANGQQFLDLNILKADLSSRMINLALKYGLAEKQEPMFTIPGNARVVLLNGAPSLSAQTTPAHSPASGVQALVECPVCGKNISPVGTYNCGKCGRKYVCCDCWDKIGKSCADCAEKKRKGEKFLQKAKELERTSRDVEAVEYYRRAAEMGMQDACHRYGDILLNGELVKKNVKEALGWYLKADTTKPWVQHNIGICHLRMAKESQKREDAIEAIAWLRKSTEGGIAWAWVTLGNCHMDGTGVDRDFAKARQCYLNALAAHPDPGAVKWAEWSLGNLSRDGLGVEKNLSKALQWYQAAAKHGLKDAEDEASKIISRLCNPGDSVTVEAAGVSFNLRRIPAKGKQAAFWMGETQVTQKLWTAVMGSNPSQFKNDDLRPVECVSWDDCQDFLKKLNAIDEVRYSGFAFRLPTAEEWEHACRAGSTGKYCRLADGTEITDASVDRVAWFDGNSSGTTHPVGQKEPNAWGLCDMHGNVGEWTQTADGANRLERGGSLAFPADSCKSSGFSKEPSSLRLPSLGFRLAASNACGAESTKALV